MMKKPFKKKQQGITGLGTRTVFNNFHEAPFNPNKLTKWYGVISEGGKNFKYEYECKFRSEAVAFFEEKARLSSGTLATISAYK
ncbi:hypothetical protein [Bacillus xiapuensis]|uniref:Uncharacterized protein n=1 Tax=Bacillus xiapuensis TaxID=2014075 RepID=A0ABU6N8R2_9BACI|nr:hypothetical protein [Bacillus xiapuensis]